MKSGFPCFPSVRFVPMILSLITASFAASSLSAGTITVGTPNSTSLNCAPIVCANGFATTGYEQVYASSQFSGAVTITGLTLLDLDLSTPGFPTCSSSAGLCNTDGGQWTIFLSTTNKAVNGLSQNLASNVGADEQQFGSYTITAGSTTADSLVFAAATAFTYDPSQGNLLVRFSGASLSGSTNNTGFQYDSTGTVTSRAVNNTNPSLNFADSRGIVTQFTTSDAQTPEPGTAFLLAMALAAGVFLKVRSGRSGSVPAPRAE